jgi:hypothetical protein
MDEFISASFLMPVGMNNLALISSQNPLLSLDCKKKEWELHPKELLGILYRDGKVLTVGEQKGYDHDFSNLGKGKVIPHGIYDLQTNQGINDILQYENEFFVGITYY